mmetsp:Transcript_176793/g.567054  ORF Transcript_176793/g.567054 Transcript_176793/m.567054 type:complete len:305 (+) Transcript_176793:1210-2124(+)
MHDVAFQALDVEWRSRALTRVLLEHELAQGRERRVDEVDERVVVTHDLRVIRHEEEVVCAEQSPSVQLLPEGLRGVVRGDARDDHGGDGHTSHGGQVLLFREREVLPIEAHSIVVLGALREEWHELRGVGGHRLAVPSGALGQIILVICLGLAVRGQVRPTLGELFGRRRLCLLVAIVCCSFLCWLGPLLSLQLWLFLTLLLGLPLCGLIRLLRFLFGVQLSVGLLLGLSLDLLLCLLLGPRLSLCCVLGCLALRLLFRPPLNHCLQLPGLPLGLLLGLLPGSSLSRLPLGDEPLLLPLGSLVD